MTIIDVFWAVGWFVVGLVVFQIKVIKSLFDTITGIFSAFSLLMVLLKRGPVTQAFTSIGLGYISGIFTFTIYRIGRSE